MTKKTDNEHLIDFCQLLSIALKSGQPLPQSLAALSGKTRDTKASNWCKHLSKRLAEGMPIEQAVNTLTGFDPTLKILMPIFKEKRLDEFLNGYTTFLVNVETASDRIRKAFVYPLMLALIVFANIVFYNYRLFPHYYQEHLVEGTSLPFFVRFAYFVEPEMLPFGFIIPALLLIYIYFVSQPLISRIVISDSFVAKIAGINMGVKWNEKGRLLKLIALYIRSGFSYEKAVLLSANVACEHYSEGLVNVAQSIAYGNPINFSFSLSEVTRELYYAQPDQTMILQKLDYLSDSFTRHASSSIIRTTEKIFIIAILLSGLLVLLFSSGVFESYNNMLRGLM